jgi:kynurenine formamidase
MDIDERMPGGPPEAFPRFARAFCATPGRQGAPFDYAAEVIFSTLHTSTHIDAFVHVQRDGRIFGGASDAEVRGDRAFTQHGAETIQPILCRGVVLDVAAALGRDALEDGYEITAGDIEAALERAGTPLRAGDAVLVRTGKIRDFHTKPDTFHEHAPGVGPDAAIWLHERGMAVLGVDTSGTEPAPIPDLERTTHVAMLVERGVHLIENVMLDAVCAAGVTEGLFVCLPLRITGATGSWVRPVLVI